MDPFYYALRDQYPFNFNQQRALPPGARYMQPGAPGVHYMVAAPAFASAPAMPVSSFPPPMMPPPMMPGSPYPGGYPPPMMPPFGMGPNGAPPWAGPWGGACGSGLLGGLFGNRRPLPIIADKLLSGWAAFSSPPTPPTGAQASRVENAVAFEDATNQWNAHNNKLMWGAGLARDLL